MALDKRLKKGGVARQVLKGIYNGDYFSIPRGFKVDSITLENRERLTQAGTVSCGSSVGTRSTATFTVTTALSSAASDAAWGGGAAGGCIITAAQVSALPVGAAAQKAYTAAIIAASAPARAAGLGGSWVVTSSGAVVTMTTSYPVYASDPTFTPGSTGIVISAVTMSYGSVDMTYMESAQLTDLAYGAITPLSFSDTAAVVGDTFGAFLSVYFSGTVGGSAGTYTFCGKEVSIPASFTAALSGWRVGGRALFGFTISASVTGAYTINGVSVTSDNDPATAALNLGSTYIPGWIVIPTGTAVLMVATTSGSKAPPVYVVGTGSITGTATPTTNLNGFSIPGYHIEGSVSITDTITVTGVAATAGVYEVQGTQVQVFAGATVAQTAQLIAGCACYQFIVGTSYAGTCYLNDMVFDSSANGETTASNIASLDVPGWIITSDFTTVTMMAITPEIKTRPVFTPGVAAIPIITSEFFVPGIYYSTISSQYTPTTAVWSSTSPTFRTLVAPSGQTVTHLCTYGSGSGRAYATNDSTISANSPSMGGAISAQTYTLSTIANPPPCYMNLPFELEGKLNLYVEYEKLN